MIIQPTMAINEMPSPTIAPWFLTNYVSRMIQEKNHFSLNSNMHYWVHHQLVMFDFPSHKLTYSKHITCLSNPLNNNGTIWNFIRHLRTLLKWKQINSWNYQTLALEEFLAHLWVSYKIKLWRRTFQMTLQENFPL